ncbi:TetR/AcrR family transcriptional regulator [Ruania zhangjianzhongii]|uniref:TetR/AcrR family transcriptional regulator n=1 Tax=Ruania zhangjianzhongii TaxID=2603206 RepID=UPI001C9E673B|nr:helix-turn-helix domain-containing protein [Ruania zhangjianzhongii]
MVLSRSERTRARLVACALELFEAQGFERTTVAQIAAAAEVTEMTFFRHFASKELVILTDPYDPVIADAVAAQPVGGAPVIRATRGVRQALRGLSEPESELVRRRVRIIAGSPSLRASSIGVNAATERLIGDQLIAGGASALAARAAAAAVLAVLTAALFEWARDEQLTLPAALETALRTLEGER